MACSIVFSCDVCGNPKRETNHWWMIVTSEGKIGTTGTTDGPVENSSTVGDRSFQVIPWKLELAAQENVHHACGQMCVLRAIERFMGESEIFAARVPAESAAVEVVETTEAIVGMNFGGTNFGGVSVVGVEEALSAGVPVMDDLDTLANSVADSVVFDMDEEGELSAVMGRARPKYSAQPVSQEHQEHQQSQEHEHLTAA
jgi:hypothetical protein